MAAHRQCCGLEAPDRGAVESGGHPSICGPPRCDAYVTALSRPERVDHRAEETVDGVSSHCRGARMTSAFERRERRPERLTLGRERNGSFPPPERRLPVERGVAEYRAGDAALSRDGRSDHRAVLGMGSRRRTADAGLWIDAGGRIGARLCPIRVGRHRAIRCDALTPVWLSVMIAAGTPVPSMNWS